VQVLAIICRSYGAYRDLDAGSYKDFAPTEHDLGLPNVQTPATGEDARPTIWRPVPHGAALDSNAAVGN